MTRILAIDPGITTGYALIDEELNLLESGNLYEEDLECCLSRYEMMEVHVVVEDTPIPTRSPMNKQLKTIVGIVDKLFPHAQKVTPGRWKSSWVPKLIVPPKEFDGQPLTPHQKDAFHIAVFSKGIDNKWNTRGSLSRS